MKDGQIPGAFYQRAAIYKSGILQKLPQFAKCATSTTATSVNAVGQAVGFCAGQATRYTEYALLFSKDSVQDLGRPYFRGLGPGHIVEPLSINDRGDIVGISSSVDQMTYYLTRFFVDGRKPVVVPNPAQCPFDSCNLGDPNNINSSGLYSYTADPLNFGSLDGDIAYIGYKQTLTPIFPTISNIQEWTGITWINDDDVSIGWMANAQKQGPLKAYYRTRDGWITLLPSFSSTTNMFPTGINNKGEIVGFDYGTSGANRVFLYSAGRLINLTPLITPAGTYYPASGLSDDGSFLAQSRNGWVLIRPNYN